VTAIPPGGVFEAQRRAANPAISAWVMANAGSGKTRVLTDRVIRLLLAGAAPNTILCLTFTKAAAAEMANRLHQRLGKWSVLPEHDLRSELSALLGRKPAPDEIALARQLFARTLDAVGRLRIQTIHAFCESVLKRFPLEAGVPPHFAIADDSTSAQLLEEARDRLLSGARAAPLLAESLMFVVGEVEERGFQTVLNELVAERRKLRPLLGAHGEDIETVIASIRTLLGVAPADSVDAIRATFAAAIPVQDLTRAAAALDAGATTDRTRAQRIRAFLRLEHRADRIDPDWLDIFMTAEGEPRKVLISQKAQKTDPGALAILDAEQQRVITLCERLKSVTVATGTAALLRLGNAVLEYYAEAKRVRALLDYDDLILKTGELLQREGSASWVLYKLDGGIDHVLVDEAQDTSPEQWDVVKSLCGEFFAGRGAHDRPRTVFAVGDAKQSIFSFQGADPIAVTRMQAHFETRARAASQVFDRVPLEVSFRSCAAVLETVDAVFNADTARDGVASEEQPVIRHRAFRAEAGGLVELWEPTIPQEEDPGDPWDAPLDYAGASSPPVQLAHRIAGAIRRMLDSGEILESRGRPIQPGDILILVRRRDAFFAEMVRALKAANVPVAGADRMVLAEQIAVMDLLALARFVLLPEDDLNLATVLKGPLFSLDDDDLFALCHGRVGRLWRALRERATERPHWQAAVDELRALLARADQSPPFEFFADILGRRRGRERLVTRLGHEASDPIDEFVALTLTYERQNAPTLQGFLAWFEAGAAEIKRDMEQGRNEARVMTVHGAKGLEASIVFLPDTCSMPDGRTDPRLLWTADATPLPLWPIRAANDDAQCSAARQAARLMRTREYRRLLYVAATRARDRLYICGWQRKERPAGSWYDLLAPAIEGHKDAVDVALPWPGRRLVRPHLGPSEPDPSPLAVAAAASDVPKWCADAAPPEPTPPRPLMPSRPAAEPGVRSPLGADDGVRFARGRLVHRLLQTLPELPPEARAAAAVRFLERPIHGLDEEQQALLAREVLAVLDQADFAPLFAEGSVAEVPVVGRLGDQVIAGQIDRLVVTDTEVLVLDYKTQRPVPASAEDAPTAYVRQMAAYRRALAAIYSDRTIRCCLLWTDGPSLMELPGGLLDRHVPH
jgi:ATP-dependent helicase/nuclease subunit A